MIVLTFLSALVAVCLAAPGYVSHGLVSDVPGTAVVEEPVLAKVGEVVHTVPSVSHFSHTIVHKTSPVVRPILAPTVNRYVTPVVLENHEPVLSRYGAVPALREQFVPVSAHQLPSVQLQPAPLYPAYSKVYTTPLHYGSFY